MAVEPVAVGIARDDLARRSPGEGGQVMVAGEADNVADAPSYAGEVFRCALGVD